MTRAKADETRDGTEHSSWRCIISPLDFYPTAKMRKMPTKVTSQISTSRKPRLKWFIAFTIPTCLFDIVRNGILDPATHLLSKPFTSDTIGVRVRDLSTIFNRDRCARHAIPIATEYIEAETGRQTGLLGFHAGLAAYHSDTRLRGSSALFQLITDGVGYQASGHEFDQRIHTLRRGF